MRGEKVTRCTPFILNRQTLELVGVKGAAPSTKVQDGVHGSDSGGGRRSLITEARVEVCGEARGLVAVCGEHHRGVVHVCHRYPDDELWEKHP